MRQRTSQTLNQSKRIHRHDLPTFGHGEQQTCRYANRYRRQNPSKPRTTMKSLMPNYIKHGRKSDVRNAMHSTGYRLSRFPSISIQRLTYLYARSHRQKERYLDGSMDLGIEYCGEE